jgi:hypothetical protein
MTTTDPAPAGSLCALHRLAPAERVCARCGNFMCRACSGAAVCPSCQATLGVSAFPYSRQDHDLGRLASYALERFRTEWLVLTAATLLWLMASLAGGAVGSVLTNVLTLALGATVGTERERLAAVAVAVAVGQGVGFTLNVVVQGGLLMGLVRMAFDVLQGGRADLGRLFSQFGKLGTYAVLQLLILLVVGVPLLLFLGGLVAVALVTLAGQARPESLREAADLLAAGPLLAVLGLGMLALVPVLVYVGLPLGLAPLELTWSGCGARESLTRSWSLAAGHRFTMLGMSLLGGALGLLGVLACCVGLVPALALWYLMHAGLFLALRSGSGLPD